MATPATLIYNVNARNSGRADVGDLTNRLQDAGFNPVYRATQSEEDLDAILAEAEGLVVVVGGDGTVGAVASRMVDKGVPLAIVPMGTANNVANTLGLPKSPFEILERLADPMCISIDVGRVRHPWGSDTFLEAAGCGIFADILFHYDPTKGKNVLRALGTLKEVLVGYEAKELQVRVDGEDLSGRHLGIEVLNMKAVGPRLKLAPNADPSDGLLDVVRLLPNDDVSLLTYAGRLLTEGLEEMPNVDVRRGRRIEISWNGDPLHVDDALRPLREDAGRERQPFARMASPSVRGTPDRIEIEILAGALEVWVPKSESEPTREHAA